MSGEGSALLLTGGHSHPAELSAPALRSVLATGDRHLRIADDLEDALASLSDDPPDLLVVNALRWRMTHPRYDEFRPEWAFSLSAGGRAVLADWVSAGRPLLALHTALICFDNWTEWGELIGGRWDWDRSFHPPLGPVAVCPDPSHPVTAGLGDFVVDDECYVDLDVDADVEVIATGSAAGVGPQPVCWIRRTDGVRVATSTLGHDQRSLDQPEHRRFLGRLIDWLLTMEGNCEP